MTVPPLNVLVCVLTLKRHIKRGMVQWNQHPDSKKLVALISNGATVWHSDSHQIPPLAEVEV
jgi:hypothetical protein